MSFVEAMQALVDGKRVRCCMWHKDAYIDKNGCQTWNPDGEYPILSLYKYMIDSNWEVV